MSASANTMGGMIVVQTSVILGALVIAPVLLVFLLFYSTIPWHDLSLWRMERVLTQSVAHPTDSRSVQSFSFFGSRYTDVSECTYAVGEIRKTNLSAGEVEDFYEGKTVRLLGFDPRLLIQTVTILSDSPPIPLDNPALEWIDTFRTNKTLSGEGAGYYLVYLYASAHPWWGDIRCFE